MNPRLPPLLLAILSLAPTASAQDAALPRSYLPAGVCDGLLPRERLREAVLGDSRIFLLLNPRLRDAGALAADMRSRGIDGNIVDELTTSQTDVPHLAQFARHRVETFLGVFLGNIEEVPNLAGIPGADRTPARTVGRKEVVVTVDVGLCKVGDRVEVCLALRLSRLTFDASNEVKGCELMFADRAVVPLAIGKDVAILQAYEVSLRAAIRELASGLLAWPRMVTADWRTAHAATLGGGLNDALPERKEAQ